MYRYDEFDRTLVLQRVDQFRDQVARRLSGELTEEQFKPLRLMNGVYLQLHAYMLRVNIPYGTLSSRQMRGLAHVARRYDKGYGHFTTRQNIQYNWPKLAELPDMLADLAEVEMHGIQSSGNCVRNVTADQYGGVIAEELDDPRVWGELIRQWSTLHPELSFLPRKFKIAVTGAPHDRAAVKVHDIGLRMVANDAGERGFEIIIGGGLGRTPYVGQTIYDFVPEAELLAHLEALMRVYNRFGRRDNKYKARIKILVDDIGVAHYRELADKELEELKDGPLRVPAEEVARIRAYFAPPTYEDLPDDDPAYAAALFEDRDFARWARVSVTPHKQPGYAIVDLSLKPETGIAGDCSADQMDAIADIADRYSFSEIRVAHEQNLVLPHVRQRDLPALWRELGAIGVATPNIGLISDLIACPGLDYCSLANARSIPVGQRIWKRFADLERQHDIGKLHLNISGCINACGHHHVGHIGILGVDKKGEEFYQITIGGRADEHARLGDVVGPAVSYDDVVDAVDTIVRTYLALRTGAEEPFIDAVERLGADPFRKALAGEPTHAAA
ncbi:MAG: nitrite/sulfite reductase [Azospirillaceae bacterium]